jgi:DNA repair protein RadA/Sms
MLNGEVTAEKILNRDSKEEALELEKSLESLHDMANRYKKSKRPRKIMTGIKEIDDALGGGIEAGQLIGVGGEPEAGKSSLLERIIDNVAEGHKSVYYTLEFAPRDYAERYTNRLEPKHKNIKVIPEDSDINVMEHQIRLLSSIGYKFFVIDSQMKVVSPGREGTEVTKDVFLRLKNLARMHELIIFIIVQSSKKSHDSAKPEVYGSVLAEHELNQFWFLSSDKQKRMTTIKFAKNKQNGRYTPVNISWGFEFESDFETKEGTMDMPIVL